MVSVRHPYRLYSEFGRQQEEYKPGGIRFRLVHGPAQMGRRLESPERKLGTISLAGRPNITNANRTRFCAGEALASGN